MKHTRSVLMAPFFISLIALAFCVWSAIGNDVNLCISAGCSLYQDFTIGGISLWWIGTASFGVMACLSLLGLCSAGAFCAFIFLLGDVCLLLLLALTSPCISCLIVAVFFVLLFIAFTKANNSQSRKKQSSSKAYALAWVWLLLFTVNIGAVVRSQFGVWPILGDGETAATKMFFSPSCVYCMEGINALSGNVDVAFYPLADNPGDVARIARMQAMLEQGMNIAETLGAVQTVETETWKSMLSPSGLILRFRLLRNKSHVLSSGSPAVPFFEHRGLPKSLTKKPNDASRRQGQSHPAPGIPAYGDSHLPAELTSPECSGAQPCQ